MHLFRTEMLFLHPPTPGRTAPSQPRYGSRAAGLVRYGRAARRDASCDEIPAARIAMAPDAEVARMRAA